MTNTARAAAPSSALPTIALETRVDVRIKRKVETYRIFDIMECSSALKIDMERRGYEGKMFSAERVGGKCAAVVILYRVNATGDFEIAVRA